MDVGSISAAFTSLKTATELAKIIKDSTNSLEQAEVKFKLADLLGALAEAKVDMAEVQELLIQKDKEISSLKKELETKGNINWEKPYYFLHSENAKEGPFCPTCYDKDNKLIRLQEFGNGCWKCLVCNAWLEDSSHVPVDISPNNDGWL